MRRSTDAIFVGREDDLQKLLTFARNAFAGAAGVAFVTGEAGIGKTTLAEELFRRLQAEYGDVVVAVGRCTADSVSYLPFRALLENLLPCETQACPDGAARQITDATRNIIRDVGVDLASVFGLTLSEPPENAETTRLQQRLDELQQRWDLLSQGLQRLEREKIIAIQPDEKFRLEQKIADFNVERNQVEQQLHDLEAKIPQTAGKKSEMTVIPKDLQPAQIFGWYTKVMQNLAPHFPLALFIDDLQWADQSSLNLLLHLGRETQTDRILVIGTYRPHEVSPDSLLMQVKTKLGRYGAQEFSLDVSAAQPAAIQKAAQFVHEYLLTKYGTNFSDQFEALLVKRTEGNALFLTEILKNLEEKGQIETVGAGVTPAPTGWQLTAAIDRPEDLPEKVENVISERVDRLKKRLREILDYASVEGDDFSAQVIARGKQVEEARLLDDLTDKLMKIYQLIWERGDKALPNSDRVDEFAFKHNLIREYVYAKLPKSKKRRIHAEIGECLERLYEPNAEEIAAKLAVHFYHGHIPDKAVRYCLKASQDANQRYGAAEAMRFARMGLEVLEEQTSKVGQHLPDGVHLETKVRFLLELAKAEEFGGEQQEEKDHIQAGIDYLKNNLVLIESVPEELQAAIYAQLGKLYERKGTTKQEAKDYLEKALNIYEQNDDKKNSAEILCQLGEVYQYVIVSGEEQSPTDKAIKALKKALSLAERLQNVELQSQCLSRLTWRYSEKNNITYAEQCVLQALKLSKIPAKPDPYTQIKIFDAMAKICREQGRWKTGIQYLEDGLRLARQIGDIFLEVEALNDLGVDCDYYITLKGEAQHALEQSISIRERAGYAKFISLSNLGWVFIGQGNLKKAEECFRQAIAEAHERSQSIYRQNIGWLYFLQGKHKQAETEFLYGFEIFKKYQYSPTIRAYIRTAVNYALLGNLPQTRKYLETTQTLIEQATSFRDKWSSLYFMAEGYRLLREYEHAKTSCQQAIDGLLTFECAEELEYLAEARLIMGKILVDLQSYQEALQYLDKAQKAFAICEHYNLGETLLYMGKAYQGLGPFFFPQAKELVTKALTEFQRVELPHKEREAQEVLKGLEQ